MAFSDVGSMAWARRTGGRLSRIDRAELLKQGVLLQLKQASQGVKRRMGLTQAGMARLDFERLQLPDSAMARHAEDLLNECSPAHLVQHCHRTYLWGAILAQHDGLKYDAELLYVACLLHDLGLTARFNAVDASSHCFALDGALAAQDAAREHWDEARRDRLAQAIVLHLNPTVGREHGAEAHLVNAGAALDVAGLRKWEVARETQEQVLLRHPRENFKVGIDGLLRAGFAGRPCCRAHFLFDVLKFGELIKRASFRE